MLVAVIRKWGMNAMPAQFKIRGYSKRFCIQFCRFADYDVHAFWVIGQGKIKHFWLSVRAGKIVCLVGINILNDELPLHSSK